jgi:hypothetical protein
MHHPFKGVVKPFAGKKQQFVSAGVGLVGSWLVVFHVPIPLAVRGAK